MEYYHWFPFHPTSSELTGKREEIKEIGKAIRIVDPKDKDRIKQHDLRRIASVPDIWSQHQLFDMLLTNADQDNSYMEYEEIVVREWRAMLAVLLLADAYDVKVRRETIDFTKEAVNPYISAAYKTRPKADRWNSMDIYYIEDVDGQHPIAMSSPTVHIVPTKDAWEKLQKVYPDKIPWLKGGKVHALVENAEATDLGAAKDAKPVYTPGMIKVAKDREIPAIWQIHALVLKRWLDAYDQKTSHNGLLKERLIQDYSYALNSAYKLETATTPNIDDVVKGHKNGELQIWRVPVPKTFKLFSDTVHYAIIEQGARYDRLTDIHKAAGGLGDECLKALERKEKYVHFFIPMPVTEMFWKLWDENAELEPKYEVKITPCGEDIKLSKIEATVTIGNIVFSRLYEKPAIEFATWYDFCTAGIWPRQRIDGWSKYFMFCVESSHYRLTPEDEEQIINRQGYQIEPEHEDKKTAEKTSEASKKEEPGKDHQDGGKTQLTYYMLKQMPERCKLYYNNALLGYVTTRKSALIGTANNPRIYEAALDFGTSSTTLFGRVRGETKETLISGLNFWSMPLLNPRIDSKTDTPYFVKYFVPAMPLTAKEIMETLSDRESDLPSYRDIPAKEELAKEIAKSVPLQSILADAAATNIARQPLFDSWIFYRAFLGRRKSFAQPKLYPNLKWCQSGDNNQKRVEAMLMQLLYMIALEAKCNNCSELSLTASYPLSFKRQAVDGYFTSLGAALNRVIQNTGLAIHRPDNAEDNIDQAMGSINAEDNTDQTVGSIIEITESEAAFRYAASAVTRQVTYCVIDIGGGSADIFIDAVNDGISHCYSSSIRFGARKILLEGLRDNNAAKLKILVNNAEDSIKEMYYDVDGFINDICKSQDGNGESSIEDLLGMKIPKDKNIDTQVHNEKTFGEAYAKYCAGKNPGENGAGALLELKKRVAFYLASIIFCAGLMLRDEKEISKDSASVILAGNGSKMIHWIHRDEESKTEFVYRLFLAGMHAAIAPEDFECEFSKDPKLEVASGSLKGRPAIFGDGKRSTSSQVRFGTAAGTDSAAEAATGNKTRNAAHEKVVEAGRKEFNELLEAYKTAASECFDWTFKQGEYSAGIFDKPGRHQYDREVLKGHIDDGDAFLIGAVDALSQYYLACTTAGSRGRAKT